MEDTLDPHCLIFYHIEKTAGTTFNDILARQYKNKHLFHLHGKRRREDISAFKKLSQKERAKIRCITGHMSHLLADHTPHPARYVTFLRDPLTQVMSSYHYAKTVPKTKAHDRIKHLKNIDEYFDWQLEDRRDNIQTRYLANVVRFMEEHTGPVHLQAEGEKYLRIAKDTLANLEHVFITEKFDEALLMLKKELAWPKNVYYWRKNASTHREKLTKSQEKRLREVHRHDFELYELAQQRHEAASKKYGSQDLSKDLQRFQKANLLAGPVVEHFRPEHWARTVVHHARNSGILPGKAT